MVNESYVIKLSTELHEYLSAMKVTQYEGLFYVKFKDPV